MKKVLCGIGVPTLVAVSFLFILLLATRPATADGPAPLTGTYAGSVVITKPVGLDSIDLAIVLTDTNGSLTGYIDSARLVAYPVVATAPAARGPSVTGARSGDSFILQSEVFTPAGSAVAHQLLLTSGVISATGEILTGQYREQLTGLTPGVLAMTGTFSLSRPANRPASGQLVEVQVSVAPVHVRVSESVTVTAHLVDFDSNPISGVLTAFSAPSGQFLPAQAASNGQGYATVSYLTGSAPGPITITASASGISGSGIVYVMPNGYIYLPLVMKSR